MRTRHGRQPAGESAGDPAGARIRRGLRLRMLLWLPVPLLLYWSLRDVRLGEILSVLGRLRGFPLAALLGVNLLFLAIVTARWALILKGLHVSIPLAALGSYRLAGFAVSYLTPGPQFGGEPVQLLLAKRRSGLDLATGSASVLLDRSFELLGNLLFLGVGASAIASLGVLTRGSSWALFLVPGVLILLPVAYLTASFSGRRPLSWLLDRLPPALLARGRLPRLRTYLASAEGAVTAFGRRPARSVGLVLLFFALVWAASLLEMRLALRSLGIPVRWDEVVVLMAGSRFAFLLPFPGALGALEATQVSLFGVLGLPPEGAWALVLYIRARDLLLAALGLLVAGVGHKRRHERASGQPGGLQRSSAGSGSGVLAAGREPGGAEAEVLQEPGEEGFQPRVR